MQEKQLFVINLQRERKKFEDDAEKVKTFFNFPLFVH